MKIIAATIDLNKIDKSKIKTTDKNGVPFKNGAKFYDIQIILNDEKNKFDQDTSITTSQTKEERESKAPKTYIGNGKTIWTSDKVSQQESKSMSPANNLDNDLPF